MATRKSMQPVDKITAVISGTLAAGFFALAAIAALPSDEPTAPILIESAQR
ncbi:hypothetical protein [Nocardioides sp.]|uniref:hypothetical protein n=1 Tax=Nocardioides sp. TaxID=35761 RepID=UPI002718A20C|nr:hypothetical protein [Nocardioides sp.]MDO9456781.1 hypothetical protein [Nocardioides sp.]